MPDQLELFPEEPKKEKPVDEDKVEKARARKAENNEFADKRVKASRIVAETELAKMRDIANEIAARKPGRGAGMGGMRGSLESTLKNPIAKRSGGKIKSASARADGCAIRGKTRA